MENTKRVHQTKSEWVFIKLILAATNWELLSQYWLMNIKLKIFQWHTSYWFAKISLPTKGICPIQKFCSYFTLWSMKTKTSKNVNLILIPTYTTGSSIGSPKSQHLLSLGQLLDCRALIQHQPNSNLIFFSTCFQVIPGTHVHHACTVCVSHWK